jgi:ABC-type uncharacterized transport system ATPase subunit
MTPPRIETAEDLELIVAEQTKAIKGLGELVKGMDARIKLLSALIDHHHDLLIRAGLAKPRPEGTLLAN